MGGNMIQDQIRKEFFISRVAPHLRALRVTSLWLTKNRHDTQKLVESALARAYAEWHPSISSDDFRILLFKILTSLFFEGFQKKPFQSLPTNNSGHFPVSSLNRLAPINIDTSQSLWRTIIRLPLEIRFVGFLSKMDGFSPIEICEIIGLKPGLTSPLFPSGARLLQGDLFSYSGRG